MAFRDPQTGSALRVRGRGPFRCVPTATTNSDQPPLPPGGSSPRRSPGGHPQRPESSIDEGTGHPEVGPPGRRALVELAYRPSGRPRRGAKPRDDSLDTACRCARPERVDHLDDAAVRTAEQAHDDAAVVARQSRPGPVFVVGRVRQAALVGLPDGRGVRHLHGPLLRRLPGPVPCARAVARQRRDRRRRSPSVPDREHRPGTGPVAHPLQVDRLVCGTGSVPSTPATRPAWSPPVCCSATHHADRFGWHPVLRHHAPDGADRGADHEAGQSQWYESRINSLGIALRCSPVASRSISCRSRPRRDRRCSI